MQDVNLLPDSQVLCDWGLSTDAVSSLKSAVAVSKTRLVSVSDSAELWSTRISGVIYPLTLH